MALDRRIMLMAPPKEGPLRKTQRIELAFTVVTLTLVCVLGGLDFGSPMGPGPPSSGTFCPNPINLRTYYNPTSGSLVTDALLEASGSTSTVCAAYHLEGAGTFIPQGGPLLCGTFRTANGSAASGCSGQIVASTSSLPFYHPVGIDFTVTYVLRASESAGGVFWFWVDCGEFFPIVVGLPPPSLTFPIISGCVYEPNALSSGTVTGSSNLTVAPVSIG